MPGDGATSVGARGALNFHLGVEELPSTEEPLGHLLLSRIPSSLSPILILPQDLSPLLSQALKYAEMALCNFISYKWWKIHLIEKKLFWNK